MKAFVVSVIEFPEDEVLIISYSFASAVQRYIDVFGHNPDHVRFVSYTDVLLDLGQKETKDGRSQD